MENSKKLFLWQQTFTTLLSVSNKLQVYGDKYISKLTVRQLMAAIAIAHLPKGEASLNGIAKKLGTTKQNIKQLINAMEKKGYVVITPSAKNKRAYNVEITKSGQLAFMESYKHGIGLLKELFKDFSVDELEALWGALKKLYSFDGEEQDGLEESAQQYSDMFSLNE
jgi:DNA-binding MarR family transcriptional regulator